MATLADELRSEIMQQCKESTRSFLARREYVINEIRGGKREVFFSLAENVYYKSRENKVSRSVLETLDVPEGYRVAHTKSDTGIIYRNGKHYTVVEKRADTYPHVVIDTKEYCVEDMDCWLVDYLYSREELLDVGRYFESEGFHVSINRKSDYDSRWPYKTNFFNIAELIVSL